MKTARLTLLVALCVPMCSIAQVASNAPSQKGSSGAIQSGGSNDAESAVQAGESEPKDTVQKGTGPLVEKNRRLAPGQSHAHTRRNQKAGNHRQPVPSNRAESPGAATKIVQTNSSNRAVADHRATASLPTAAFAIGGQQFQNRRKGVTTPAVVGGSATVKRNQAAINGTEVTRKR